MFPNIWLLLYCTAYFVLCTFPAHSTNISDKKYKIQIWLKECLYAAFVAYWRRKVGEASCNETGLQASWHRSRWSAESSRETTPARGNFTSSERPGADHLLEYVCVSHTYVFWQSTMPQLSNCNKWWIFYIWLFFLLVTCCFIRIVL